MYNWVRSPYRDSTAISFRNGLYSRAAIADLQSRQLHGETN